MPGRIFLVVLFILTLHPISHGQSELRFELGRSFIAEDFPNERSYHIWLISFGYAWRLAHLGAHARINCIAAAQYGDASTLSHNKHDFDLASNLTLEFLWQLHESVGFVASIGSGPGYQSSSSIVQVRGFIFSNSLSTGFRFTLAKVNISSQIRFRHMSNAHTKAPNQGIDNLLILIGVTLPLGV